MEDKSIVLNNNHQISFRGKCNRYVGRLRKIQILSLIIIVISVSIFFLYPNVKNLALLGIIGEFYAWLKIKKIKCYNCNHSLSHLFLDPNYSKTGSSLIFPKKLSNEIKSCPYCHADFD